MNRPEDHSRRRPRVPPWAALLGGLASLATIAGVVIPLVSSDGTDRQGTTTSAGPNRAPPTAKQVASRALESYYAAQYGDVWKLLYAADKRVVSRGDYIDCENTAGDPAALVDYRFAAIYGGAVRREGLPTKTLTFVDFDVVSLEGGARQRKTVLVSFPLVKVNGRWNLVLSQFEYNGYRQGECARAQGGKVDAQNPGVPAVP